MFDQLGQVWYVVIEGKHKNDYEEIGEFLSKEKALRLAKKSKCAYVRVDAWQGNFKDRDGDYVDTIYIQEFGVY